MSERRTQRLRDPVHGLITFRKGNDVDELAWRLIQTPEFQRLRRIKQLGVSEFVFPGATHTRFAHSIGVFHTARKLIEVIEAADTEPIVPKRRQVALVAALLHDVGHGPFSHTFEEVQKSRRLAKSHEEWTAEIIRSKSGSIRPLLDAHGQSGRFCDDVADLLEAENPTDIYHAVVSSSLDADRLDYLQRDRLMTGTGAGAIDFDWILEHVRVAWVRIEAVDEEAADVASPRIPTICLDQKALPAAEQFLLARYALRQQVYYHKTTRSMEQMIALLLEKVAARLEDGALDHKEIGLDPTHPLVCFFQKGGENVENYLALDDTVVLGALGPMSSAQDPEIAELASRLKERRLFKTLDVASVVGPRGRDQGEHDPTERDQAERDQAERDQAELSRRIEKEFESRFGATVFKDTRGRLTIYDEVGDGSAGKAHKKVRILVGSGKDKEISSVSDVISALARPRLLLRYYFADEQDRDRAKSLWSSP